MTLRNGIKTILFMLIITIFFISILSFVHLSTKERVQLNEELVLKQAILFSAGFATSSKNAEEIESMFKKNISKIESDEFNVYAVNNGNYVFIVSGAGLWGEIVASIGIKSDMKTLTGIDFIKQNETPGLGARITELWFRNQFRSKLLPLKLVEEEAQSKADEINAITGATSTSTSVIKLLNNNFQNVLDEFMEN